MVKDECRKQGIEQKDYRFSRKRIREVTGWSDGQLKIYCSRLTELEYLLVHRGGRGQSLVYELLYDGDPMRDDKCLMGLIDTKQLSATVPDVALPSASMQSYDDEKLGLKHQKTAPSQGQVRAKSDPSQANKNTRKAHDNGASALISELNDVNALLNENNDASHRTNSLPLIAKAE